MKYKDCEYCGESKGIKCESCINYSNFRKGFKAKDIDEQIAQAEKLVQAKMAQDEEEAVLKKIQTEFLANMNASYKRDLDKLKRQAINASAGYEEGLKQAEYIKDFPFNKPCEIQSSQIVRMSLQGYENLTNRVCNQELEIKNLKSAIEDMNSKLLKKNKEINELQTVIKTLGGLL